MTISEKREKKIERHIQLGYRCKTCKKPLPSKFSSGKPEECDNCKNTPKKEITQ